MASYGIFIAEIFKQIPCLVLVYIIVIEKIEINYNIELYGIKILLVNFCKYVPFLLNLVWDYL